MSHFEHNPFVSEYKLEWRRYVAEKNLEQISQSFSYKRDALKFSFYRRKIVDKIFRICTVLKQPPEARYLALDVLDRFMMIHYIRVSRTLGEGDMQRTQIANKMTDQAILSVLSAIQLASKYCSTRTAVTSMNLHHLLITSFEQYSTTKYDVVKSEANVYRTIDYKIPAVTPLTCVEMFFEDFCNEGMAKHLQITVSSFLNVCIDVLDVASVFHREIFDSFYYKVTGKILIARDPLFIRLEGDYVYLAASVIYAAATIQDSTGKVPLELLKYFSVGTEYKTKEIESLGSVIFRYVIGDIGT